MPRKYIQAEIGHSYCLALPLLVLLSHFDFEPSLPTLGECRKSVEMVPARLQTHIFGTLINVIFTAA